MQIILFSQVFCNFFITFYLDQRQTQRKDRFHEAWLLLSMLVSDKMLQQNILIKFLSYGYFTSRKVSKYGVISGPYFPVFGLNTEIHAVNLRIQPEYRKIRSRNNTIFRRLPRSAF